MLIPNIFELFPYAKPLRGVLHVGAHTGEELELYHRLGLNDGQILWVEANADYAKHFAGKRLLIALVGAVDGESRDFFITNNGQSSSMLPLKYHLEAHPSIRAVEQRKLVSMTLDTLFAQRGIAHDEFDVINLDIQGAELLALQGAERILANVKAIYTEVNEKELYADCALLPQLDTWLEKRGFQRVAINMTEWAWGDALYLRLPNLQINHWHGRLGNNLVQIMTALLYSERANCSVTISVALPGLIAALPTTLGHSNGNGTAEGHFFYGNELPLPMAMDVPQWRRVGHARLGPLIEPQVGEPLPDSTLVIHVRSGDLFRPSPSFTYGQPPLAYYRRIIEQRDYAQILIVTEPDRANPCIAALEQLYGNRVQVQSSTLEHDALTLLRARNLVIGVGTFAPALLCCYDKHLQHLHAPIGPILYGRERIPFTSETFAVHIYRFPNYLEHWTGSAEQRQLMLNYPADNIACT